MRTVHGRSLVWLVVLLGLAGASSGEEPAPFAPPPAPKWQVGDAVAQTETLDFAAKNHYWVKGGSSGDDDLTFHCEAAWEEHCLEIDAEGRPVRLEVRITSWTWTSNKNAEPELTLAGRTVLVEGLGAKRKATLQGKAGSSPWPGVWIGIHYGSGEGLPGRERFLPREPVPPEATWTADFAGFAKAALDYEAVADKVSGEVKLASLQPAGGARLTWKAEVPTKGHSSAPVLPWTKDGTAHMEGEVVVASAARLPHGSEAWTCALSGEATGGEVSYRIVKRLEVKRTYAPLPAAAAGAK